MTRNNLDELTLELEDIDNNGNVFGCTELDEVVTLWINKKEGGKRVSVSVFKNDLKNFLLMDF